MTWLAKFRESVRTCLKCWFANKTCSHKARNIKGRA
jgi:hypothetical protein